eukprot:Gb_27198 [translate_table: standard]
MEWENNKMKTSTWEWDNLMLFPGNGGRRSSDCKIKEEPMKHESLAPSNAGFLDFRTQSGGSRVGVDVKSCDGERENRKFEAKHSPEEEEERSEKKQGDLVTVAVPAGSGDSVIGLKLGKRTYFEAVKAIPVSSSPSVPAKKQRSVMQGTQIPRCQVEGCKADLTGAKDYHRRHKVCEIHSKSPKVTVAGLEQRFCQQCSRFHVLSEFDEGKRSCRRRLAGHNERRRKPQPDSMAMNHARLASTFYEDRRLGSILMDRSPFMQSRFPSSSTLGDSIDFKLGYGKGTWPRIVKAEDQSSFDGQIQVPAVDRQSYMNALSRHNADRLLLFLQSSKTVPSDALNQGIHQYMQSSEDHVGQALTLSSSSGEGLSGIDVASATHGLSGVSDSGCALSLLSSQSWASRTPGSASFDMATRTGVSMDHLIHEDQPLMAQPMVQGVQHNFGLVADKLLSVCSQSSTSLTSSGFPTAAVNCMDKEQQGEPLVSNVGGIGNFEGHMFGALQGNNFRGCQGASSQDIQRTIDLMRRSSLSQTNESQGQPGTVHQGSRQFSDFQMLRSFESSIYDSQQML